MGRFAADWAADLAFSASRPSWLLEVAAVAGVAHTSGHAAEEPTPIFAIKLPLGYRDWRLAMI
jgi:hypothetical protein